MIYTDSMGNKVSGKTLANGKWQVEISVVDEQIFSLIELWYHAAQKIERYANGLNKDEETEGRKDAKK